MSATSPHSAAHNGPHGAQTSESSLDRRRSQFRAELLDKVYEPVHDELERVGMNLRDMSRDETPFLAELLDHVLDDSGKRVRPALTLLASKFHPNDGRGVEIMATAVELLHVATLIHDDTVDDSDVRRGKATVSSRWGRNKAILLGDFLLASSSTLICDTGHLRVIRRFSEVTVELSSGELHEMDEAYNPMQSRELYMRRIHRKTASLFSAATEAGAVLSGASEPAVEALKEYGLNLGMAFQIVDDILDFDGTSEEVGKPVGSDLGQGIVTLPAILAMERHPDDNPILTLYRDPLDDAASKRPVDQESLKRAIELVQGSSVLEESYAVADQFCDKALASLGPLERNAARDSLEMLVGYLVRRRS